MRHPSVMRRIEITIGLEGTAFLNTTTDKIRDTKGVHLLIAPYIGMFIPCNAKRLKVACKANKRLAGRKSLPSRNEYGGNVM